MTANSDNHPEKLNTLLIISNDDEMISVWETLFEQKNCRVISETSARTGLQTARLIVPTLIVLNLDIPESEKLELCRELRATTNGTLLLMASKNNVREFSNYQYAGVDEFISTPISPMAFFIKAMAWLVKQDWLIPQTQSARAYV